MSAPRRAKISLERLGWAFPPMARQRTTHRSVCFLRVYAQNRTEPKVPVQGIKNEEAVALDLGD